MPTRYAIIGSGMMGQEHIRNIALLPDAEVTAIADPDEGMRHAAANFSAFVAYHMDPEAISDGRLLEEFQHMLEYYAQVHGGPPQEQQTPTGLHQLVNQVKDEF